MDIEMMTDDEYIFENQIKVFLKWEELYGEQMS